MKKLKILLLSILIISGCGGGSNGTTSNNNSGTIGNWTIEVIATGVEPANGDINAVIDNNGKLHVSFYDTDSSSIIYATNKTGKWILETIESEPASSDFYLFSSSLTLTPDGSAYICYTRYDNMCCDNNNVSAIVVASKINGNWTKEVVFTQNSTNQDSYFGPCVIKANKNGMINTSFVHITNGGWQQDIIYSYRSNDGWHYEVVGSPNTWGSLPLDLAIDGSNISHIIYPGVHTVGIDDVEALYSAVRTGANTWNKTLLVDNLNYPIGYPNPSVDITNLSTVCDSNGKEYIMLYENTYPAEWLYYAGQLTKLTDVIGGSIPQPRIAIDSNNSIYYLYFNEFTYGNFTIFYGTDKTGTMVNKEISEFQTHSPNSALAIDEANHEIYIVFRSVNKNELLVGHSRF